MKINAENERIKRRYFVYLKEASRLDQQSIDAVAAAIDRFQDHTKRGDFRQFRIEQAISFKKALAKQTNVRTGERLAKSTLRAITTALKDLFFWLAGQPGFKSRFTYSDADYFQLSLKDAEVASASGNRPVPTLDHFRIALAAMPTDTDEDRRDRAILAFAVLTGARDGAIATTCLKNVDLTEEALLQDGRNMRTKYAKSFPTYFFPVGSEFKQALRDWIVHVRSVHAFGPDDPIFPPIKSVFGPDGIARREFDRRCWTNATPIRKVFKVAFTRVGLPAFHPHSVRKTLVQFGLDLGIGEAGLRAWSQNLGHDGVITTLKSYGELPPSRQRDLIRAAAYAKEDEAMALRLGRELLRTVRESGVQ